MSELQASAAQIDSDPVPRHVAIIMDGNHRWAKARGLPGAAGHRAGARNIRPIAEVLILQMVVTAACALNPIFDRFRPKTFTASARAPPR